ncbi:HopJ type III effector protein [Denitrificimonas sp. JX-1]|uniref:HopJ type III effector protein n=1 Tax=Denitrificimonas halotolerans TaxID=3098930 RepID=A0ABU5GMV2_9GAMM|nr:HopJ type III effector protein [Denitrificimonas sp. JX-1]MDY7218289.1 HopJ type III effector protein [Denitrificimonas sp. JX-1]
MTLTAFLQAIRKPGHQFADTLAFIDAHYQYTPRAFDNAELHNPAGSNQGSCKILGLALLEKLSTEETLLAFGEHYAWVLANPEKTEHNNIRQLIKHGLAAVSFTQLPLRRLIS